ncbi:hypothetical protein L1887_53034 [Cichorium endivia]|nr:hypothetical protein L1887_53034 [Cichorium endivia]
MAFGLSHPSSSHLLVGSVRCGGGKPDFASLLTSPAPLAAILRPRPSETSEGLFLAGETRRKIPSIHTAMRAPTRVIQRFEGEMVCLGMQGMEQSTIEQHCSPAALPTVSDACELRKSMRVHACRMGDGQNLEASRLETTLEVLDEIRRVLDTDADSDQVVADADLDPVFERYGAVGHLGRQLDQALHAAERFGEGEYAEAREQLVSRSIVGGVRLDSERDHAAVREGAVGSRRACGGRALRDLSSCHLVTRVGWEAGVDDRLDARMRLEELSDSERRLAVRLHAERKRLEATKGKPAVKRRWDRTDAVLQKGDAVGPCLVVGDGDTHDDVAVTVEVLGDAVHDEVGAVRERVLEPGAHERVVDDNLDVLAGVGVVAHQLGNERNVDDAQSGVGGRLDPNERGLLADGSVDALRDVVGRAVHLDKGGLDALGDRGDLGEVAVGAAVDVVDADNVGARGHRVEHSGGDRRAGREGETAAAAL